MNPVRICHVSTMTQLGGVELILSDLLTHTEQAAHQHILLTTSSSPDVMERIKEKGILHFQPTRRFHYDFRSIFQMARWLSQQNVQIVHGYNAVGNAWGYLAALLARIPVFVAGEHGTVWSVKEFYYWINRLVYKFSSLVITNSEASKKMICFRYAVSPEKVRVIYNIVAPLPEINREKVLAEFGSGSKFIVGSVGRLSSQKGYKIFIDAANEILKKRKDILFVIVGGGDEELWLKQYIDNLGIKDNFILTGWRKDARDILQIFDIFVSTSVYEPFGNVLIESALAGVPVIAPRLDGIPEAVVDGVTGVLVPPTLKMVSEQKMVKAKKVLIEGKICDPLWIDPKKLANEIIKLVNNRKLRQQLGKAAQKRAKELYSVERYIKEIESVYSELAQGKKELADV